MEDQSGKGKAKPCKDSQDVVSSIDSTGLCLFTSGIGVQRYVDHLDAAVQSHWTEERFKEVGERIWNLERLFNLQAGFTAADDTLPPRMLKDPAPSGTAKGKVAELDVMLPEYYAYRGWGNDGVPTPETLARLGLTADAAE